MGIEKVELPSKATQIGQATAVEQARAVAEVQAAVIVAQQVPRVTATALAAMRESCSQQALAEQAFFSYPRAGQVITGPSVHLARELARCWGNVQYGVQEMRRDDTAGVSEMQAWAWDVETNTRSSHTFIVPHKRDKSGGPQKLTDMRDIYENNANNAARRVREAIFSVLPPWYTEEAKDRCATTLANGGGKPLATRIADAIALFENLGASTGDLERRVGRPLAEWTDHDVAQLAVSYKSIMRNEVTFEELFPQQRVTAAELTAPKTPEGGAEISDDSGGPEAAATPPSAPSPPEPPVEVEVAQPASDETRTAAKAAKTALRTAMGQTDMAALFASEGIDLPDSKWTEEQALRVIEMAGAVGD